ncbi:MAG TPA: cytochrome c oxidase subunit 3 family protein [Denitromonas sp.]|uniref:cytochrome c oxidase subunit 3 family protein n=1 Tax=Denitromonas sp. TaxID=2734609 RepID=UPI001E18ECBE|nr:cytochrome c oxidase subunit 3 family protein [Rhodocyclaceae bacterium]MCP5223455.1 cytochrome c oxidase subunit 3 family protein [Zoogloeaceae bacterium]HPR05344.1 cytochrome c oxidase subunit 3 family protein [Denitromonas sp.]HQU88740.1 cytochrome c oxidase subunit 3 family protein [Denitromonas sp.]HQV14985.1 cytochrome c oxidase subunit 3 family protein [Denitromonas sp.]
MSIGTATFSAPPAPVLGRIPGNKAIWVGIYCELTEFALMFIVYFLARAHHPEAFRDGPQQLSTLAGVTNTVIMLTSSYFVARGVMAMRRSQRATCLKWLTAALFTGIGYPVVKFFEVQWNVARGLSGNGEVFQMAYYYLTFNHLVHVCWGLLGLLWVMARTWMGAYDATDHDGLEAFACYWHATDLIWLMIFPLFYVLP